MGAWCRTCTACWLIFCMEEDVQWPRYLNVVLLVNTYMYCLTEIWKHCYSTRFITLHSEYSCRQYPKCWYMLWTPCHQVTYGARYHFIYDLFSYVFCAVLLCRFYQHWCALSAVRPGLVTVFSIYMTTLQPHSTAQNTNTSSGIIVTRVSLTKRLKLSMILCNNSS